MHQKLPQVTGVFRDTFLIIVLFLVVVVASIWGSSNNWQTIVLALGFIITVIVAFISTRLLLFAVFGVFLLNQTYFSGGNAVLTTARWVMLSVCCFLVVMRAVSRKTVRKIGPSDLVTFFFLAFAFISAFYSIDTSLTIQRTASLLLFYITIFWMVWGYADEYGEEKTIGIIVWCAGLFFLLGLVAMLFTTAVWQTDGRFRGISINPNSIGILAAICAPLFVYRWFQTKNPILLILLISLAASLLLSGSRNGFLAMLIGLGYLISVRNRAVAGILIIGAVLGLVFVNSSLSDTNTSSLNRLVNTSDIGDGSGRLTFWAANLPIIEKKIWNGYGFGTEDEGTQTVTQSVAKLQIGVFHNSYLGMAFQLGLPGVILFFGPLIFLLIKSISFAQKAGGGSLTHVLQAVMISGLILCFFETWVYSVGNAFTFPFWVCVMLLLRRMSQVSPAQLHPATE